MINKIVCKFEVKRYYALTKTNLNVDNFFLSYFLTYFTKHIEVICMIYYFKIALFDNCAIHHLLLSLFHIQ